MRALFALDSIEFAGLRAQIVGRSRRARHWVLVAAAVTALLTPMLAPSPATAASVLSNGTVSPGSGNASTTFTFTVHYDYSGSPALEIWAMAGITRVDLALVDGGLRHGTWQGTSTLPVGTLPVTFFATIADGTAADTLGAGNVDVSPAPTPTPTPTPRPPTPTPRPTATPRPTVAPTPGPTPPPGSTPLPTIPGAQPTPPPPGGVDPTDAPPNAPSTPRESELGGTPGQPDLDASEPENGAPAESTGSPDPSDAAADGDPPRGTLLGPFLLVGGTMSVAGAAVLGRQWYVTRRPK